MAKAFNHGYPWTEAHDTNLLAAYEKGTGLRDLCYFLGRTGTSIIARLEKHGKLWTEASSNRFLRKDTCVAFSSLDEVYRINEEMGQPESNCDLKSVTDKAQPLRQFVASDFKHFPRTTQTTTKENDMNHIDPAAAVSTLTIESSNKPAKTVTYIYGAPSEQVTDAKIFDHIADLEKHMASFNRIENQPKKLQALLNTLQGEINALSAFVDSRP